MKFTYKGYIDLLSKLVQNDYKITSYDKCDNEDKCVILRHDIDYCLEKTIRIGEIEKEMSARSTFFLLISTDFYNVFSYASQRVISTLLQFGHDIGLHFDEQRYPEDIGNPMKIRRRILEEAEILSHAAGMPIKKVSMHRPSKEIIDSDLNIPGVINTYGSKFINDFKYVSDSRRRWREPIEDYIKKGDYRKIQILTHPFWYNESELSLEESVKRFIMSSTYERYDELDSNITKLEDVIKKEDIR